METKYPECENCIKHSVCKYEGAKIKILAGKDLPYYVTVGCVEFVGQESNVPTDRKVIKG